MKRVFLILVLVVLVSYFSTAHLFETGEEKSILEITPGQLILDRVLFTISGIVAGVVITIILSDIKNKNSRKK